MLDHLVGSEVDTSQKGSFAHDFFLTHVAFISMADICSGLLTRYRERKEGEEENEGEVRPHPLWGAVVNIITPAGCDDSEEKEDSKSCSCLD